MTAQEATGYINSVFDEYFGDRCVSNTNKFAIAQDVAIKVLEKQIPKKIKQDVVNGKMVRWCPNGCDITYITKYSSINYCPYCGQAIKWGDTE